VKAAGIFVTVFCFVHLASVSDRATDPRIELFEKFNRANSYEEVKPLVSGVLAGQLAQLSSRPEAATAALNHLRLVSYHPRIVEMNSENSFLVLEHAKNAGAKEEVQAYLLTQNEKQKWTLANRVMPQSVIPSLWTTEYSAAAFNQPSSCSVQEKGLASPLDGKMWDLQSAVAFRDKDKIEIDLNPFPLTKADLDYWKYLSAMPVESSAFQTTSVKEPHAECRIIVALDKDGQVTSVNVGFNDPAAHYSKIWQGPGWAWSPPRTPKPTTRNGLPAEFPVLEITKNRIKLETTGELESGGGAIHWKTKIDIPLWDRGL
jgi:hypothetical protein